LSQIHKILYNLELKSFSQNEENMFSITCDIFAEL